MPDALGKFESAKNDDRVVSAEDLRTKLSDFTQKDWQAISRTYDKSSDLVNNFYVEEKADSFVVHNDPDAIHDAKITSGAWGLVRGVGLTGIGLGIGQFALRFNPYARIAGTALGAIAGAMWYRSDSNRIAELEKTSYPLTIPKDSLKVE